MATSSIVRFHPPKPSLFPTYIRRQKTTSYPETPPRGVSSQNQVATLSWSPLGTQIATGSIKQRSVKIWDAEKPRVPVTEFRMHATEKVLYNPDGAPEVASMGDDGVVRFWDVRTKAASGECKVTGQGGLYSMSWSPDGSELVVGKKANDDMVRIDRATRSILATTRQRDQTNQTCFNWKGNFFLTTTTDGYLIIHDYPSLQELARFPAHNSSCNCIAYHPHGAYVATGASDGLISLYRTDGWLPSKTFDVPAGTVKSVSFSCDGTYIVGGSDEGPSFEICHVETGDTMYRVDTKDPVPVVQWSPKDYALAYAEGERSVGGIKVMGAPAPS